MTNKQFLLNKKDEYAKEIEDLEARIDKLQNKFDVIDELIAELPDEPIVAPAPEPDIAPIDDSPHPDEIPF